MAVALACVVSQGCSHRSPAVPETAAVLVTVGDSALELERVTAMIPPGLGEEDSLLMFQRIVSGWVRDRVLTDVASRNVPDMDRIERMVSDYRADLLAEAYLRAMSASAEAPAEMRVRDWYEAHAGELELGEPAVKGILVRAPAGASALAEIRAWVHSASADELDRLETPAGTPAVTYEYFMDNWTDWSTVADRIPHRFEDAGVFLSEHKEFETESGEWVYMLHIESWLPAGAPMPWEYARTAVAEMLRVQDNARSRRELLSDIYTRQIKEGNLKPGLYDPVKGLETGSAIKTTNDTNTPQK